jgi:hypothetical protein
MRPSLHRAIIIEEKRRVQDESVPDLVFLFGGSFDRDIDHEDDEADDDEFHESDGHEGIVSEVNGRNKVVSAFSIVYD